MKKVSFRNDILPLKDILYRLALRITLNKAESEDIVQDTLIKVWNRREDWDKIDSIEAFSLTVCRNLALDSLKKAGKHVRSLDNNAAESPDTARDPAEKMAQKDRIELVKKLIAQLPERQRSCLQLRDFEGKPYKEIAQILQMTEEQVKINIFRGRQAIKQKYLAIDKYGL